MTASILTCNSAHDYVQAYFAKHGETVTFERIRKMTVCGTDAVEVTCTVNGRRETFAVWEETREDGTPYLYGEY